MEENNNIESQFRNLFAGGDIKKELEKRIRISPTSDPDKDSCCTFRVLLPKDTRVKDVIEFALNQDEWGTIEVRHGDVTDVLDYERHPIGTKRGRIKYDQITDEVKGMKVKEISSYGGWSRMDYKIKV